MGHPEFAVGLSPTIYLHHWLAASEYICVFIMIADRILFKHFLPPHLPETIPSSQLILGPETTIQTIIKWRSKYDNFARVVWPWQHHFGECPLYLCWCGRWWLGSSRLRLTTVERRVPKDAGISETRAIVIASNDWEANVWFYTCNQGRLLHNISGILAEDGW